MGGMGGMGGGTPSPPVALSRLIRNLAVLEKMQNKGLDARQAQKLLPILNQLEASEQAGQSISEKDAEAKLNELQAALTDDQKQSLQDLQPQRGGGFGGGGKGGGGKGGGGMGGMGQTDPNRPFALARNRQALKDLTEALQNKKS